MTLLRLLMVSCRSSGRRRRIRTRPTRLIHIRLARLTRRPLLVMTPMTQMLRMMHTRMLPLLIILRMLPPLIILRMLPLLHVIRRRLPRPRPWTMVHRRRRPVLIRRRRLVRMSRPGIRHSPGRIHLRRSPRTCALRRHGETPHTWTWTHWSPTLLPVRMVGERTTHARSRLLWTRLLRMMTAG